MQTFNLKGLWELDVKSVPPSGHLENIHTFITEISVNKVKKQNKKQGGGVFL